MAASLRREDLHDDHGPRVNDRDRAGAMVTGDPVVAGESVNLKAQIDGSAPLPELVAMLAAVCDCVEDRAGCDAVILRVSGLPKAGWATGLPIAQVSRWERALRRLERLPVVTIAIAEGDCGGAALDALLATDYRIMSASGRLLLPVVAGATWPGMVQFRLVRRAVGARARRAVLSGGPIEAGVALAMGVVDEVAADAATARESAARIAESAPEGAELAIRRQLVLEAQAVSFDDALGVQLAACDRALRRAAVTADDAIVTVPEGSPTARPT